MLLPVLDIKSTSHELVRLCRLLAQAKLHCDDSNLIWKIAQLVSEAEELNQQFTDEFNLWPVSHDDENLYDRLVSDDEIEALLSSAFNSAAVLDAAVYKEFVPSAEFVNSVKFLRTNTLSLLHERRGWR